MTDIQSLLNSMDYEYTKWLFAGSKIKNKIKSHGGIQSQQNPK
jgi:hypothetical protein